MRHQDGKLLSFIRGCQGLAHVPIPVRRLFPISSLFSSLEKLCPTNTISFSFSIQPMSLHVCTSHTVVRRILVGLLGGTIRTYRRHSCPRIQIGTFEHRNIPIVAISSGKCNVIPRTVSGMFIPFFAAGRNNSKVNLDIYHRVVGQRNNDVSIVSRRRGKAAFALRFPRAHILWKESVKR